MSQSQNMLSDLLECEEASDVDAVIETYEDLKNPDNWRPYGDVPNNFGQITNQQASPVASLVEKIVNSQDAILQKRAVEEGIDPESNQAPQSVQDATRQFFNGQSRKDRIHVQADGSKKAPTITIADRGKGQSPERFPDTFLSLQSDNKLSIPFVQGKFNMGSTGALPFATNGYQLILSRSMHGGQWGWTLVKKRPPKGNEKSPLYVYYYPGETPSIEADELNLVDNAEPFEQGTCVRLYSYEVYPQTEITTGIKKKLRQHLFTTPLPVHLHENRDYDENQTSTLYGMQEFLEKHADLLEEEFPLTSEEQIETGETVKVRMWLFREDANALDYTAKRRSINYTINGQIHGFDHGRFLSRKSVQKDYLKKDLLVEVDCSDLSTSFTSEMFMASRDRMFDRRESKLLKNHLENILREDETLQEYNRLRREQKINSSVGKEETEQILRNLISSSPGISHLLGGDLLGKEPEDDQEELEIQSDPFSGKKFPSFLNLENNEPVEVPKNSWAQIQLETDVEQGYFDRDGEYGSADISPDEWWRGVRIRKGHVLVDISPPKGSEVGDEETIEVEVNTPMVDSGVIHKEVDVLVDEKINKGTNDPKSDKDDKTSRVKLPDIHGVDESGWEELGWDKTSVVDVQVHGNGVDIFVNLDNEHLKKFLRNKDWSSQGKMEDIRELYKIGIGLIAFGIESELEIDEGNKKTLHQVLSSVWLPTSVKLRSMIT